MNNRIKAGVVVAMVAGLVGAWLWLERSTRPADRPKDTPGVIAVMQNPGEREILVPEGSGDGASFADAGGEMVVEGAAPMVTASDILSEPGDDYVAIAKKLSTIVTDAKQPMEERQEALGHALNLSAGNEAEVLMPLVKDPTLPDELTGTVLDEALNRPLGFQADLYLAALPVHKSPEMQTKIREHLAFLTDGEDLGADPKAWEGAVKAARQQWAE